ncbi:MAG: hypothetical protein PWP65_1231 [Clostridia bacterium]|nr:hypothetical protein [Clostridia bacterium]
MNKLLFGLEEEVFITEPDRPSLQSLYYLARLLWRSPGDYYTHTACNFTRGKDIRLGLMSGIEISTRTWARPEEVVADLTRRRQELSEVCSGLIVPVGHLFDEIAPTNICGLHIHVSGFADADLAYRKLVYFLPLLTLLTVNSPLVGGRYFGQSYRLAKAFAIGPLRPDRKYRFQDLIYSKRLGTLEIRVFDPIWDLDRIRILLQCVEVILESPKSYAGDIDYYNRLRPKIALQGYIAELRPIYYELNRLIPVPEELFWNTPANAVRQLWEEYGTLAAYSALDNAYRNGELRPRELPPMHKDWLRVVLGFCGYYLPKIPYNLRKVWLEW